MDSSSFQRFNILGVKVDSLSKQELANVLKNYLGDGDQHFLATVNAEFIIEAQKNKRFRNILKYTDLNLADGIGILWAAKYLSIKVNEAQLSRVNRVRYYKFIVLWQAFYSLLAIIFYPPFLKTEIVQRITGVFLLGELIRLTGEGEYSAYILGGKKGIAASAKNELEKKHPGALIVGSRGGSLNQEDAGEKFRKAINSLKPDILIVGFGAPKQEEWIFSNMDKMPSVKLAVGVGGALDFLAKKKRRAPKWMRKRGMEWLFRFYLEPQRFPRIKNATFNFIKEVIKKKIKAW